MYHTMQKLRVEKINVQNVGYVNVKFSFLLELSLGYFIFPVASCEGSRFELDVVGGRK